MKQWTFLLIVTEADPTQLEGGGYTISLVETLGVPEGISPEEGGATGWVRCQHDFENILEDMLLGLVPDMEHNLACQDTDLDTPLLNDYVEKEGDGKKWH